MNLPLLLGFALYQMVPDYRLYLAALSYYNCRTGLFSYTKAAIVVSFLCSASFSFGLRTLIPDTLLVLSLEHAINLVCMRYKEFT